MKTKNFEFPTAYTVLFLILIVVTISTHFIPAGVYSRLNYNPEAKVFVIDNKTEQKTEIPATQENLDKLGVQISLEKFEDGTIKKPMAIPNTYRKVPQEPRGLVYLIKAPIEGIVESVDIIIFILILGGTVGLINKTGTFNSAMKSISQKTKGKEFFLIVIAFIFVVFGGTTFGFWEETIPFYSILVPLFLVNGFDILTCMATIFLASAVGCMFSTVNPFSTIIASNAAGISFSEGLGTRVVALILSSIITLIYIYWYAKKVKKNPEASIVSDLREISKEKFLKTYDENAENKFTLRQIIILALFVGQFIIMVYGVAKLGWWFQEMSALFFAIGIIIMLVSGLTEKDAVNSFIAGASEVVGVTLIIGLARAINIVMEGGMISDTLLYYSSGLVAGMGKGLFSLVLLLVFAFLGIFIPSTSGLAVLSMPIFAPLADTIGLPRETVVDAFAWGQGLVLFITPTGLIFVVLQIVGIPYNKWLKFVLPLILILAVFTIVVLYVNTLLS